MRSLWGIAFLAFVLTLAPCWAQAQRVYRVGALVADDQFIPAVDGFKQRMVELGYVEGKNITYDFQNSKGDQDLLRKLAETLVQRKPDLIVTSSTTASVPMAKITAGTGATLGEKSASWTWHFDRPPADIWPLLADTARVNEVAKIPKHAITEIPQPDGSVQFFGRVRMGPFDLKWREKPVNWVSEQWFEHCRYFESGPLKSLCAHFTLEPNGDGALGHYRITAEAANLIGRVILATGFFPSSAKTFGRLAEEANEFAKGGSATLFSYAAPQPKPEVVARVARLVKEIEGSPNGHGLAQRLADLVLKAQEVDLWHIRPLKLAHEWDRPAVQVIELCLQAVRAGLLELRWDLLCPRCRVAKAWSGKRACKRTSRSCWICRRTICASAPAWVRRCRACSCSCRSCTRAR